MPHYVSEQGLKRLLKYKSYGEDRSLLLKYVLRPMYHRLIEFVPLWLSPNLMTLFGFLSFMIPYFILTLYCDFTGPCFAPRGVALAIGLGLFTYQTADNMDGRQARRTGTSSPLGEFFDHGVDSLIITVGGLGITSCALLSGIQQFVVLIFTCWMPFFLGSWECLFSGNGLLLREFNGPIEGVIMSVGIALTTAAAGPHLWLTPLPAPLQPLFPAWMRCGGAGAVAQYRDVLVLSCLAPALPTMVLNVQRVVAAVSSPSSKASPAQALAHTLPFFAVVGGGLAWAAQCPEELLGTHHHCFYALLTLAFASIVGHLVMGHICKGDPVPLLSPPALLLPLAALTQPLQLLPTATALYLVCAAVSLYYARFVTGCVRDFLSLPRVYLFRIPYPPPSAAAAAAAPAATAGAAAAAKKKM